MKAMKLTLAVVVLLVSTSPAFSHFVKAALGFRLGYSPTEQGYGQKGYGVGEKKGVGVQMLGGVNNGGYQGPLKAAGSGYGVGLGQGRSYGGGPLDAHVGGGAVKHLRILGLNLYLGGRAAHPGGNGIGISHQPPLVKKPIYNLVQQHQPYLEALAKPVSLGAGVGAGLKPVIGHAPNGGKYIGGVGGVRAAVGTPGFGLGFNLGYKQGINTKSPLGYAFGLQGAPGKYYSLPVQKGPIYKGQDQVFIPGSGVLKGHGHDGAQHGHIGHDVGHNPLIGYQHGLDGSFISGLESKHHLSTQPLPAASNTHSQGHPQNQHQQQPHPQASHQQPQQAPVHPKHQGLQGPLAMPSSYSRNPFLAFLQGRPSILRPTPYKYTFNSPQALPSGPLRMVMSPHPPTPAPQRPRSAVPNDGPAPGWSTLFPVQAPQSAHTNFINPIPANGQSLAKLQATLRPGNPFQRFATPVTSAQHQIPFYQPGRHAPQAAPQQQFQGFYQHPQHFGQAPQAQHQGHGHRQAQQAYPQGQSLGQLQQALQPQQQNQFQQYFSNGFQQAPAAPVQHQQQGFNIQGFQENPVQHQQFHQSPVTNNLDQGLIGQQSPFFNPIPEQPSQAATPAVSHAKSPNNFPNLPEIPFTQDSVQFAPEAGFQYSHSDHSEPIKMGDFTMHMDMTGNGASGEQSTAGSSVPMFGPMGRRLVKKAKKSRHEAISKKQGTPDVSNEKSHKDIMETSASSNSLTLSSSLGSTSWTPMISMDIPKIEKKSMETPVTTSLQVLPKKPVQQTQSVISPSQPSGTSAILTGPAPALGTPEYQQERTMILKKRRLFSSAEVLTNPTVIPSVATSSSPSSTTTTTTTPAATSSTTTTVAPSSSSTSPSTSVAPSSTTPEATSPPTSSSTGSV